MQEALKKPQVRGPDGGNGGGDQWRWFLRCIYHKRGTSKYLCFGPANYEIAKKGNRRYNKNILIPSISVYIVLERV